jgi:short subunit dehydrogenase-like uncharacterized protein
MSLLLYGANGYTGKLIIEQCKKLHLRPTLAGRNQDEIRSLAEATGWPYRVFDLSNARATEAGLNGMHVVLHAAGPFSATSRPMLDACLKSKTHYLDITGEIDVFAACHARDAEAKAAGIAVIPGVGFDVVPSDCLAKLLSAALPSANTLTLAFCAEGGPSRGTALSSVEGAASGGRVRDGGRLLTVPMGYKRRSFPFSHGKREAVTIPWGDVYTAFVSTGIANIEVYMAMPAKMIARLKWMNFIRPLLALKPVLALAKHVVRQRVTGPSEKKRGKTWSYLYGEVKDPQGNFRAAQLKAPNGYDLTAESATLIARHVLREKVPTGFSTPSQLMGSTFVLELRDCTLSWLDQQ